MRSRASICAHATGSSQNKKRAEHHAREWTPEEHAQCASALTIARLIGADEDDGDDAPFYKYTL